MQKETQKPSTKERLIETAIDLIWKSSYGAVSVDDICKAADVRKGSFYHYFPSKIDLAVAAMDSAYGEFKEIMEALFVKSVPPVQRFENMADFALKYQEKVAEEYGMVCGCPFISLASEMAPQDASIRDKVDAIIKDELWFYEGALRDMVEEGLLPQHADIEAMAHNLHTFVIGQFMLARIQNSLEPMKQNLKSGVFALIAADQAMMRKSA